VTGITRCRISQPPGYFDSVNENRNRIADPDLARYYDQIRLLTREPIWSARRFRAIVTMNTGGFDRLLEAYVARATSAQAATAR
jgi:arabinofuranosyltransferase